MSRLNNLVEQFLDAESKKYKVLEQSARNHEFHTVTIGNVVPVLTSATSQEDTKVPAPVETNLYQISHPKWSPEILREMLLPETNELGKNVLSQRATEGMQQPRSSPITVSKPKAMVTNKSSVLKQLVSGAIITLPSPPSIEEREISIRNHFERLNVSVRRTELEVEQLKDFDVMNDIDNVDRESELMDALYGTTNSSQREDVIRKLQNLEQSIHIDERTKILENIQGWVQGCQPKVQSNKCVLNGDQQTFRMSQSSVHYQGTIRSKQSNRDHVVSNLHHAHETVDNLLTSRRNHTSVLARGFKTSLENYTTLYRNIQVEAKLRQQRQEQKQSEIRTRQESELRKRIDEISARIHALSEQELNRDQLIENKMKQLAKAAEVKDGNVKDIAMELSTKIHSLKSQILQAEYQRDKLKAVHQVLNKSKQQDTDFTDTADTQVIERAVSEQDRGAIDGLMPNNGTGDIMSQEAEKYEKEYDSMVATMHELQECFTSFRNAEDREKLLENKIKKMETGHEQQVDKHNLIVESLAKQCIVLEERVSKKQSIVNTKRTELQALQQDVSSLTIERERLENELKRLHGPQDVVPDLSNDIDYHTSNSSPSSSDEDEYYYVATKGSTGITGPERSCNWSESDSNIEHNPASSLEQSTLNQKHSTTKLQSGDAIEVFAPRTQEVTALDTLDTKKNCIPDAQEVTVLDTLGTKKNCIPDAQEVTVLDTLGTKKNCVPHAEEKADTLNTLNYDVAHSQGAFGIKGHDGDELLEEKNVASTPLDISDIVGLFNGVYQRNSTSTCATSKNKQLDVILRSEIVASIIFHSQSRCIEGYATKMKLDQGKVQSMLNELITAIGYTETEIRKKEIQISKWTTDSGECNHAHQSHVLHEQVRKLDMELSDVNIQLQRTSGDPACLWDKQCHPSKITVVDVLAMEAECERQDRVLEKVLATKNQLEHELETAEQLYQRFQEQLTDLNQKREKLQNDLVNLNHRIKSDMSKSSRERVQATNRAIRILRDEIKDLGITVRQGVTSARLPLATDTTSGPKSKGKKPSLSELSEEDRMISEQRIAELTEKIKRKIQSLTGMRKRWQVYKRQLTIARRNKVRHVMHQTEPHANNTDMDNSTSSRIDSFAAAVQTMHNKFTIHQNDPHDQRMDSPSSRLDVPGVYSTPGMLVKQRLQQILLNRNREELYTNSRVQLGGHGHIFPSNSSQKLNQVVKSIHIQNTFAFRNRNLHQRQSQSPKELQLAQDKVEKGTINYQRMQRYTKTTKVPVTSVQTAAKMADQRQSSIPINETRHQTSYELQRKKPHPPRARKRNEYSRAVQAGRARLEAITRRISGHQLGL